MKIRIRKNKHFPFPYFYIGFPKWVGRTTVMKRLFMFDESCLYDLHNDDQLDINKLFGFTIGYHHYTSFRFGWRPNLITKKIEIFSYEYYDGVRQKPIHICDVSLNRWVTFQLTYSSDGSTTYDVFDKKGYLQINNVVIKKKTGLGYTLGLYFGGNQKAPQNIIIDKINM